MMTARVLMAGCSPIQLLFVAGTAPKRCPARATLDLDVHTQRDTSGMNLPALAYAVRGGGNRECWGPGRHAVMLPYTYL